MKSTLHLLIASVAILSSTLVAAGPCNSSIAVSSPTPRFIHTDDTVLDRRTALEWLRCPVGYTLDDNETADDPHDDACTEADTSLLTWAGALQSAEDKNTSATNSEPANWRLPNIKELLSVVERQCVNPAINSTMFPQPPSSFIGLVWSATYTNDVAAGARAYALDLGNGTPSLQQRGNDAGIFNVLLVRDSNN